MSRTKSAGGDLVIVESPAKAKTIERYLGPGFHVVASYGHVRDLPAKALGVDVGVRIIWPDQLRSTLESRP